MCPSFLSKPTLLVWKIEEDIVQQVDGIFFFNSETILLKFYYGIIRAAPPAIVDFLLR